MAKSEKETEGAPAATAAKPKKTRSKLLVLGVPVFVLLMGGGAGAWWYLKGQAPPPQSEAGQAGQEAEEAEGGLLELAPFVVNLSDLGGRKYLRVSIALLLPTEAIAKETEENKLAMSRLRSAVIEVLTLRTSVQLSTPEGRGELRVAVGERIKAVSHLEVKDVLFQEFIVQ
jgi:flagellar FliL protein